MEGFYIEIANGLLKDGHRAKMGVSVWTFMWCLDRMTVVDDDGVGWVLGRRPVRLKELSDGMGVARETVSEDISKLKEMGYITVVYAPYGMIIGVNRAKKRFRQNVKPVQKRFDQNVKPRQENVKPNIRQDSRQDNKKSKKTKMHYQDPDDESHLPVQDQDGNTISPPQAKRVKTPRPLATLDPLIAKWNEVTVPNGANPRNPSAKGRLLKECKKSTPSLVMAWRRMIRQGYTEEDFVYAVKKYSNEIVNRNKDKDGYFEHRFSLYDFLTNPKGFIKFVNA